MLAAASDSCAIWTSCAVTSALVDSCFPLTATLTAPTSLLIATDCELVRAELVLLTPLTKQMTCPGGQGVVLADLLVCTERTPTALPPFPARPAVGCCQPFVWMAIWTLTAGPPDLGVGVRFDNDVAKVNIAEMVPLALQKWAEEANVWALLLIWSKSCGGEILIRQAALHLKMYSTA